MSFDELLKRIRNFDSRGIAKAPEQSFAELFAERQILYQRYAEVTVPCDGLNQDEIADRIAAELWPMRLYSASGVPL